MIVFLHLLCHDQQDLRHWKVLRPVLICNYATLPSLLFQILSKGCILGQLSSKVVELLLIELKSLLQDGEGIS
jgi:hypothetical protein